MSGINSPLSIQTRLAAHTGFTIPQLGFGNVLEENMDEVVEAALRAGYRHFDTAQLYGTERALARTLSRLLPLHGIARSEITLVTKWNPPPIDTEGHAGGGGGGEGADVRPEPGLSVDEVYDQLLRSKADIIDATAAGDAAGTGMEYIDVMLIHQPRPGPIGRARAWKALQRAKKEGWVKEIGVSNFSISMLEALPTPVPAINQIELQPWHVPRQLVAYCRAKGILLVAFCPLARASSERLSDPVVGAIMRRTGKGWGQVLLRWSLQMGFVPIPRTSNVERVKENASLYDFELTEDEMRAMEGLCRDCRDEELGEGCSAPNAWKLLYLP